MKLVPVTRAAACPALPLPGRGRNRDMARGSGWLSLIQTDIILAEPCSAANTPAPQTTIGISYCHHILLEYIFRIFYVRVSLNTLL